MLVRDLIRSLETLNEWEEVAVVSHAMDGHFSFYEILEIDSANSGSPTITIRSL